MGVQGLPAGSSTGRICPGLQRWSRETTKPGLTTSSLNSVQLPHNFNISFNNNFGTSFDACRPDSDLSTCWVRSAERPCSGQPAAVAQSRGGTTAARRRSHCARGPTSRLVRAQPPTAQGLCLRRTPSHTWLGTPGGHLSPCPHLAQCLGSRQQASCPHTSILTAASWETLLQTSSNVVS